MHADKSSTCCESVLRQRWEGGQVGGGVPVPTFQRSSFTNRIPHLAFLHRTHSFSLKTPLSNSSPSRVLTATRQLYLPSDGTTWFIGWGWLKDPLLLLWRQRGVQRDDLDIADIGAQVVDLPLDPLAGFVNFLKDASVTINPGCHLCVKGGKNQTAFEQHLDEQWQWHWRIEEGGWRRPGKPWFPAPVHLF